MKRMAGLLLTVFVVGLVLALPTQALALTQRTGDFITVDEAIADDLYVFGTTIEITGDVDGDVIAFGQNIRVTGDVTGDVISAGQNVTISGSVGGAVRAAGSDVTVEGPVVDDVLAAGNNVRISQDGSAGRDAVVAGSRVMLEGNIDRNVLAGAERLEISAAVGGDVTADVGRLVIANGATVSGDVTYYSDREAQVDGEVSGEMMRYPPRDTEREVRREASPLLGVVFGILGWVRGLIGFAIFSLLVLLVARPLSERAAHEAWYGRPLASVAIGFAILFLAFPVAGLVFVLGLLVGGWWIAFVWLALVWLLMMFGMVVGALAVGNWLVHALAHRTWHPMLAALLGVLVLSAVGLVPFIGWLAFFASILLGMGALVLTLWSPPRVVIPPQVEQPIA